MEKKDLKPAGVFKYFEEICQVPRPSKKEEKMIAYLKAFGAKHNLETKVDEAGNVLIKKPATPGKENLQTVVLQSHIDMVCEKNNDVQHDFLTDPIETEIDGEWLKAKGTTLGADNGIGVATELAILADDSIEHGPLECLFTVDEETGLTGAFALQEGFMSGDILLNLDSEDEGEIFIGCAGGIDSVAEFTYKEVEVPAGYFFFKVEVKGLKGGHSGGDIHLGRGNANKILNRFLSRMAANMIGVKKRVIIVNIGFVNLVMFNPVLVSKSSPFQTEESCLSLEGSRPTRRYESIEVAYLDEQWMPKQLSFSGMPAQIIQHELDHLEGIII